MDDYTKRQFTARAGFIASTAGALWLVNLDIQYACAVFLFVMGLLVYMLLGIE